MASIGTFASGIDPPMLTPNRILIAIAVGLTIALLPQVQSTQVPVLNGEGYCVLVNREWKCYAKSKSNSKTAMPSDLAKTSEGQTSETVAKEPTAGDCRYIELVPQPGPGDDRWGTDDPSKCVLMSKECYLKINAAADGYAWRSVRGYAYQANGQPPIDIPPVDPGALIEAEVGKRAVAPIPHFGPVPNRIAVKVPVWLWIDDPGVQTIVASAGAVVVTATARIKTTTWSMGDSANNPNDGRIRGVAPFDCEGTGTPAPALVGDRAVGPRCGYKYIWKSTAERTGGACRWPVNVDANWIVEWSATTGEAGSFTMKSSAQTELMVGEWRGVLVSRLDHGLPEATELSPECRR